MDDSDHDPQHLLDLLNAHGQQFLASFDSDALVAKTRPAKRKAAYISDEEDTLNVDSGAEEEWEGIRHTDEDFDEQDSSSDFDDEFTSHPSTSAPVTIFSDRTKESNVSAFSDKATRKAFMSSKVTKLRDDASAQIKDSKKDEDAEEDLTNTQNDALLHKLLHTQLLSGALNSELDLTPAQRRKALEGRVMELAGKSSLGKGEKSVRVAERNKASKRVRDGMLEKQKERDAKTLEEAKELGNYHPALKKLYAADGDAKSGPRKRERGLRLGVGKFKGGVLTLDRNDIRSVTAPALRGRGRA